MESKSNKQYWSNLAEFKHLEAEANQSLDAPNSGVGDEFTGDDILASENGLNSNRRDFLKVLGFGVTAATLAASCETPVRKAIPYIIKPEDITPGIATWYASTFINGSDWCPVLVKTREGRPIKIEPNRWSSISKGAIDIKAIASVLDLYSTKRLKSPMSKSGDGYTAISMDEVDKAISGKLAANPNARIAILSESVISPSTQKAIGRFQSAFPNTTHVQYDPVSCSGLLDANAAMYGRRAFPDYHFDKTDVVVSFGADYLGSWGSPLENVKGWAERRKLNKTNANPSMVRTYQFESQMSRTGSNADYRTPLQERMVSAALIQLHNAIASKAGVAAISGAPSVNEKTLVKAASDLWAARGKSLVVCGINDANAQMVTNSINEMLNNYGNTISWEHPLRVKKGDDTALANLMAKMAAGEVDTLILYNCNPVYNVNGFAKAMSAVEFTVATNPTMDETALNCNLVVPDSHYLESWNDAEPKAGMYSLCQPTIRTIFKTREAQHSLLKWANYDGTWYDFLTSNWMENILTGSFSARTAWTKALQTGGYDSEGMNLDLAGEDQVPVSDKLAAASAGAGLVGSISNFRGAVDFVAFENPVIGNGAYTSNPWLQETPDPITKIVWDNYAMVNPGWGRENGLDDGDMVRLTSSAGSVVVPVKLQPGQAKNSIAVAVGYGRTATGHPETDNGGNAYSLISSNRNGSTSGSWEKLGESIKFCANQDYDSLFDDANRRPHVKEATLSQYREDHMAGNRDREVVLHHLKSFYPDRFANKSGLHWGMAIDLNSCIGCGACHVSCQSENNVPVVGRTEMGRKHDMHWIRIDRYYAGTEDNPEVVYQPMMCQHCDQAPCENVCPVAATNHSSEGLNQMAYNRCIGTRYCANNCPYKVRRFNWFDYMGADSFGAFNDRDIMAEDGEGGMLSDLTRMVLNPDVTVRSRGVMEKCSFCVQRIQEGKLSAKKEKRELRDGEIKTACQTACATGAITFGNLFDEESEVYKLSENNERAFRVIEEFHTLPSVTYLTKIRNKEVEDHVYEVEFEGTKSKA